MNKQGQVVSLWSLSTINYIWHTVEAY